MATTLSATVAASIQTTPRKKLTFFSLPTELRLIIYADYFAAQSIEKQVLALSRSRLPARLPAPALLLTHQTIYYEAVSTYYDRLSALEREFADQARIKQQISAPSKSLRGSQAELSHCRNVLEREMIQAKGALRKLAKIEQNDKVGSKGAQQTTRAHSEGSFDLEPGAILVPVHAGHRRRNDRNGMATNACVHAGSRGLVFGWS